MTDARTSNEVVAKIRDGFHGKCCLTAADEIERLTRELEQYHATIDILEQTRRERDEARRWNQNQVAHDLVVTGLEAERDRLRGDVAYWINQSNQFEAHRNCLRAALERWVAYFSPSDYEDEMGVAGLLKDSREALDKDSTTSQQVVRTHTPSNEHE